MDIDLLARMIGELIVDHDQVGLPGVGTFVAEVVPATFSDRGYTINPPYRRLTFHNQYLGDTLLSDFYAQTNGIDKSTARVFITEFLQELGQILRDKKTIVLPGLGRLRATKENNFFFIQDEDSDIFPDGFALRPVSLKSHAGAFEPVRLSVPLAVTPDGKDAVPAASAEFPESADEPETGQLLDITEDLHNAMTDEQPQAAVPVVEDVTDDAIEVVEPVPEPETDPAPAPAPEPERRVEEPEVVNETVSRIAREIRSQEGDNFVVRSAPKSSHHRHRWWMPLLVIVVTAVVLLGVFVGLARIAPDLVDYILYSPEELRIINY